MRKKSTRIVIKEDPLIKAAVFLIEDKLLEGFSKKQALLFVADFLRLSEFELKRLADAIGSPLNLM